MWKERGEYQSGYKCRTEAKNLGKEGATYG